MVIIFPTDTVYGIGTPIFDIDGINKIYRLKNRSKSKPLACLCKDLEQIRMIAKINKIEEAIINEYMPGALTIISEAKDEVKEKIGYETIGVRIPNNKLAISLLDKYGPMLTTSVNESGEEPINDYKIIEKIYGSDVDKVYHNDEKMMKISSTVVTIKENNVIILRDGFIKKEQIEKTIKENNI